MFNEVPVLSKLYKEVNEGISNTSMDRTDFDIIVLGVGSMGSSTCFQLAQQGLKVLGLEQFSIPHELGSHTGQSRIIRKAYAEHSDYVPLLQRAYQNWSTLESVTNDKVYYKTGLIYMGRSSDFFIKGVLTSSEQHHIEVHELEQLTFARLYPQFNIPTEFKCLQEPDAGFIVPEKSILLYTKLALENGATIKTNEKVISWIRSNGIMEVKTDKGTYTAKKLVVTAGPWASQMIPGYGSTLRVTRQVIAWVKPQNWDLFSLGNFPCWIIDDGDYSMYGFPILPVDEFGSPNGLKLAIHFPCGAATDPETVDRLITLDEENQLISRMKKFMPEGYLKTLMMKTCLYTNTPDEHFIIDFLDGFDGDVVIAAGFSGHGFKFASVIGEILSDLAVNGKTNLPIGFLSASRFNDR